MLIDQHQRIHNYLRISITDSCNFRCQYCMPDESIACLPNKQLMQPDEIEKIAQTFVSMGVNKIRLTGGEPLVRKEFVAVLKTISSLPVEITMTTNAVLVHKYLNEILASGIRTVNVSLDTLRPEIFLRITKRDQFKQVWDNILLMLKHGLSIKVNVVAISGIIEKELVDFIELTKELPLHVRFIEFMPFEGNHWESKKVIIAQHLIESIKDKFDFVKLKDKPHATAKKYKVVGHSGTFAFITTMSEHFCGDCNRMRLTADGKMKNCLFGKEEIDLLTALRQGKALEPLIKQSVMNKHAVMGGQFQKTYQNANPIEIENRSMIKIGG